MITTFDVYTQAGHTYDMFGLSTDTKPVEGVTNASTFYEMDTMRIWLFDAENRVWLAQDGSGETVGGGK